MSSDLMTRLSDAGDLLDHWADSRRDDTAVQMPTGEERDVADIADRHLVEVDLTPTAPGRTRSLALVAAGIAAAALLVVGIVALVSQRDTDVGVATGGEPVALVPGPEITLTTARESGLVIGVDGSIAVRLDPTAGGTGMERHVAWDIPGGEVSVSSSVVPTDLTRIPYGGEGADQEVRGRPGTRIDSANGPDMGQDVVILNWEEAPGMYVSLRVDSTDPHRIDLALAIAEGLLSVDEAQWADRVGATLAAQQTREEEFVAQQAQDAQAVAEARFSGDPDLRIVEGLLSSGAPFEVTTLDLELICLSLAGDDTGCMSAGAGPTSEGDPIPLEDPILMGAGEDDQRLVYGRLGQTATQVVATTDGGDPTSTSPVISDGLWALPLAGDELSGTIVFLDEDGDEVHRTDW